MRAWRIISDPAKVELLAGRCLYALGVVWVCLNNNEESSHVA